MNSEASAPVRTTHTWHASGGLSCYDMWGRNGRPVVLIPAIMFDRVIDEALEETAGVHRSRTYVHAGRTVVDVDAAVADAETLIAVIGSLGHTARLETP